MFLVSIGLLFPTLTLTKYCMVLHIILLLVNTTSTYTFMSVKCTNYIVIKIIFQTEYCAYIQDIFKCMCALNFNNALNYWQLVTEYHPKQ